VTHIYIKPSSNQRSPTSREASAAGRLRPNAEIGKVELRKRTCPVRRDSSTTRLRKATRLFTIGSETKQVEWFVSGLDEPLHPIGNSGALSSSFQSDGNIRRTRGQMIILLVV
jgi:hypothetical protein